MYTDAYYENGNGGIAARLIDCHRNAPTGYLAGGLCPPRYIDSTVGRRNIGQVTDFRVWIKFGRDRGAPPAMLSYGAE